MKRNTENPGYPTLNEFKSRKFLNVAATVGIGISAAAISFDLEAEEKKVVESNETKKDKNKEIKDKIILLTANLGNDDFKKREKSTKELISMGEKFKTEKKAELTKILKAEVQKHCASKDPEVKERAKKILLAITPKPPPPRDNQFGGRTAGVMIQR